MQFDVEQPCHAPGRDTCGKGCQEGQPGTDTVENQDAGDLAAES